MTIYSNILIIENKDNGAGIFCACRFQTSNLIQRVLYLGMKCLSIYHLRRMSVAINQIGSQIHVTSASAPKHNKGHDNANSNTNHH
ncbi:hypothetical protein G9A89_018266 [Geosiphon pyriformis]|nr:hypothetical protein G9A89_018266 [Geosiphon pyriformis]